MERISTATKVADLFGAGKHGWRDGDVAVGILPTYANAAWFNSVQEELANVVELGGNPLTPGVRTQLAQAIQGGKLFTGPGGGTADAITSSFSPAITSLKDGMALYVRAVFSNTSTSPTFTPNSGTIAAKQIVKGAGTVLAAGDIAGAGHWIEMQYDLALDKWVLLNPATGVATIAGQLAGEVCYFARSTAPSGFLKANGAAISRTAYAALFAAIGTTFGVGDGSTTFNVPDLRGEFLRGLDDGRGVDGGRALGTAQSHGVQNHQHDVNTGGGGYITQNNAGSSYNNGTFQLSSGSYTPGLMNWTGTMSTGSPGTETRPRNVALLACIKF